MFAAHTCPKGVFRGIFTFLSVKLDNTSCTSGSCGFMVEYDGSTFHEEDEKSLD